jgi:uncharacterized protein YceH (UPF0502 family)
MDILLKPEEIRVLGCLLEKKMSTPDYYPLSLNAMIAACNQKVSRDPVVTYGDTTVLRALDGLKQHKLVWLNSQGRVAKYKEGLTDVLQLTDAEAAIMCVLMLRGPQTVGELRSRTERLHPFDSLEAVNTVLTGLGEEQYVAMLPRQPGQKEARYSHLLAGQPQPVETQTTNLETTSEDQKRLAQLEEKVESLSLELQELQQAFLDFRRQFE